MTKKKLTALIVGILATVGGVFTVLDPIQKVLVCSSINTLYEAGEDLSNEHLDVFQECKDEDVEFIDNLNMKYVNEYIKSRNDSVLIGKLASDDNRADIINKYHGKENLTYKEAYMLGNAYQAGSDNKKMKIQELAKKYEEANISAYSDIILISQLFKDIHIVIRGGSFYCIDGKHELDTKVPIFDLRVLIPKCVIFKSLNE